MNEAGVALYRLLPTGECWPDESEGTNLRKFIYGISRTVEDLLSTLEDVMGQYYPGQPGMFVDDWEAQLGLPKCGQTEQTLQVRLSQILAMFRISPYSNAEFFENIASVFGFNVTVRPGWAEDVSITATGIPASPVLPLTGESEGRPLYQGGGGYPYLVHVGSWKIGDVGSGEVWTHPSTDLSPPTDWTGVLSVPSGFAAPIVALGAIDDPFKITVQVDSIEEIEFRAGWSSAGDPLTLVQTDDILECILNFFKQSHTHLVFIT